MIENIAWRLGWLVVGIGVTVAGLLLGHWFPWVKRLRRLQAYAVGTSLIWMGFTVTRLLNGCDWQTPAELFVINLAAGATVWWAYRKDENVKRLRQAEMAEAVNDELSLPV